MRAVLVLLLACLSTESAASCSESQALLTLPGRALIAGVFDIHEGEDCSVEVSSGRQQMAAAAWVVSALNWQLTQPEVQLGLRVYDACSSELSSQIALVAATVDADCDDAFTLGAVTTRAVASRLGELPAALGWRLLVADSPSSRALPLLTATAAALLRAAGSRGPSCVLAADRQLLANFSKHATKQGLCLPPPEQRLLLQDASQDWSPPDVGTCVVLGPWSDIHEMVTNETVEGLDWLLVPTDDDSALEDVPAGTLVVEPRLSLAAEPLNASVSYALFLDVAAAVAGSATRHQDALNNHCAGQSLDQCLDKLPTEPEPTSESLEDVGAVLRGLLEAAGAAWLSPAASMVVVGEGGSRHLQPVAVYSSVEGASGGQDSDVQLALTAELQVYAEGNDTCYSVPVDYDGNDTQDEVAEEDGTSWPSWELPQVSFRSEPWAAAVAAVLSLSMAVLLAVTIHLLVRICRGDVLEGRPALSLLLLFAVGCTLVTTAAFLFRIDDPLEQRLLCAARASAAALCYSLVFSLMLARALMLAACDADGAGTSSFLSHVNGYLQSSLCALMALTPAALVLQYWLVSPLDARRRDPCLCDDAGLSLQLGCDALLLLLLASVCPLAARSRRNYHEGACFCAASLLCVVSWAAWLSVFLLAGEAWRDVAVSSGLVATASSVLVAVFIPRTYLMLSSAVRSHLASALPTSLSTSACVLNSAAMTSSQQGLYASVNPDFGSGNFYSGVAAGPRILPRPAVRDEGRAAMAFPSSPPTPGKLTHF